jgi:hypothetical protein
VIVGVKRMKKINLIVIFLFLASVVLAEDGYECSYYQEGVQDLVSEENCIFYLKNVRNKATGGDALISKKVATSASYDKNGLGYLYSSVGIFYFTKAGLVRKTLYFDNGPDYFKEGLARTEWNGKIGFFDEELSIVIEPIYDFAYPFENGLSIVCDGCIKKNIGEHVDIIGGNWGAINKKGEVVYPIVYSKSELQNIMKQTLNK